MPKMQAPPFTDALIDRLELTDLKVTVAKNEKEKAFPLKEAWKWIRCMWLTRSAGDTVMIGGSGSWLQPCAIQSGRMKSCI